MASNESYQLVNNAPSRSRSINQADVSTRENSSPGNREEADRLMSSEEISHSSQEDLRFSNVERNLHPGVAQPSDDEWQLPTVSTYTQLGTGPEQRYRNSSDFYPGPAVPMSPQRMQQDVWHQPPIPQPYTLKRYATRKVKLQGSVFSVDYPVPSAIRNCASDTYRLESESSSEEFTHMRYTAATCDPIDFTRQCGYNLRPAMYHRHTELFVGITYFNESKQLLSRTLHSVMQNLQDIYNHKNSEFWNRAGPAWQNTVVCLVMDGIDCCDRDVLDVLATIGVYQDQVMKRDIDGRETVAHIFEYTTGLSITENQQIIRPRKGKHEMSDWSPVQFMVCFKTKNSRKINSHRWMFGAFGRILDPEIVVTIDVGTKLGPKALLNLWQAFYNDRYLAGACGEVNYTIPNAKSFLNPLVAVQHFEYKVAYQLDRALESALGYITVLPGAFSAYRFWAIRGKPLHQYFHGDPTMFQIFDKKAPINSDLRSNMLLAEDRMLCFESVFKSGSKWHLGFVKSAKAYTDNPTNMIDLIIQRRRWLNGAFAATLYSVSRFSDTYKSGHSLIRMILLTIQLIYNIVSMLLSWFALSAFLLTLFIVSDISGNPPADAPVSGFPFGRGTPIVNAIIQVVYIFTIVLQFILALGSRPKRQYIGYFISFAIFGFIQLYFIMNLIYLAKHVVDFQYLGNGDDNYNYINEYYADIGTITVTVGAISAFGVYVAAGLLSLDPWHLITCYGQYLFVASSYTNILTVYAFCNAHDISWGSKTGREESYADALPSVHSHKTTGGSPAVIVEAEDLEDIDSRFEETVKRALKPYHSTKSVDEKMSVDDMLKIYRTRLLAAYIFSNFFLCILILNESTQLGFLGDERGHEIWFFRIWLWANSACFILRFIGCLWYRCRRLLNIFFLYEYVSVLDNEIRLLTILPGASDGRIECCIRTVSLEELPAFGALSYVWGED